MSPPLETSDENILLDKLECLLTKEWKQYGLKQLEENYFSIEDILKLPQFSQYTLIQITTAVFSDSKLRFSVRGSKIRLKPPELNKDPSVILGKKLAWILRHAGSKQGFVYEEGGYLNMDDILRLSEFENHSYNEIYNVVNTNDKKRFEILSHPISGRIQIRAVQGHTAAVSVDLQLITDPYLYPTVIHGTYHRNAQMILEEGLKRMGRSHIHFALGDVGTGDIISGMRSCAEVVIFIDLARAMKDGIQFYLSKNNVLLSEGDATGTLLPKYFKSIVKRCTNNDLILLNIEDEETSF